MRGPLNFIVAVVTVAGLSSSCLPCHAASSTDATARPTETARPKAPKDEPSRAKRLDALFATLKRESDQDAASRTVGRIWAIWNDSGSATVDLLMRWSKNAMDKQDYATALDLLDQVTVLEPDYAEGWNRRATVRFMMKDYDRSMADIERVLSIEPRHFGALAGMAGIFQAIGKDRLAEKTLQRILAIYPADLQAQQQLGDIADKLAGQSI